MSKVLITSIGNGNPKAERYAYSNAMYYRADMPSGEFCETPLVSAALKQMYGIDEIILIGTAGSSWGPLYEYLHSEDNSYFPIEMEYDEDYHLQLLDIQDKSFNLSSRLTVDEMRKSLLPLREAMKEFFRDIIVLEYGATPEEQLSNLTILNELSKLLLDSDEVYFDISHAFRSLPFYELLTVNLAKSILHRNIRIEMVSYAMLEASRLYGGKTPIVDMTQLIELLDWTRAVDEYNRKGKFDLFLELLHGTNKIGASIKDQMSKKAMKAFMALVETMSIDNNYGDLKKMVDLALAALTNPNKVLDHPLLAIIHKVMEQVAEHFEPYKDDKVALLLASVLWKIQKEQTVLGSLLLIDAIQSLCLDVLGIEYGDDEAREAVSDKLKYVCSDDNDVKNFLAKYNSFRKNIRNKVAHGKPV